MDQGMLSKVVALREEALATLKALDDAAVSLGGKSLIGVQIVAATGSASGTGGAKAAGDAVRHKPTYHGAAAILLEDRGEPMTGAELMEKLPAKGVTLGGADPRINFTSAMSKSGKFRSVRRAGVYYWWFKNRPLPPNWEKAPEGDLLAASSASHASQEGGDTNAATIAPD